MDIKQLYKVAAGLHKDGHEDAAALVKQAARILRRDTSPLYVMRLEQIILEIWGDERDPQAVADDIEQLVKEMGEKYREPQTDIG